VRVIDVSDIRAPKTIGEYNYHPPFPEPSHTFMPVPFGIEGRRIALAIDEEDHAHDEKEVERRRGRRTAACGCSTSPTSGHSSPVDLRGERARFALEPRHARRFGAHQFQEHMNDTLLYCAWFAGGLRIVDVADPHSPQEVGFFIPSPPRERPRRRPTTSIPTAAD